MEIPKKYQATFTGLCEKLQKIRTNESWFKFWNDTDKSGYSDTELLYLGLQKTHDCKSCVWDEILTRVNLKYVPTKFAIELAEEAKYEKLWIAIAQSRSCEQNIVDVIEASKDFWVFHKIVRKEKIIPEERINLSTLQNVIWKT